MWETLVLWALRWDHTKREYKKKNAEKAKCKTIKFRVFCIWKSSKLPTAKFTNLNIYTDGTNFRPRKICSHT